MLIVYLDDAGEKRDPIATLAGFMGTVSSWRAFESEGRTYLDRNGIEYVRGVELHQRYGQFKGWNREKVRDFADGLFEILGRHVEVGMAFSVQKDVFDAKRVKLKREGAATTFCFKGLVSRLIQRDVMKMVLEQDGVDLSFVVESGNKHNNAIKLEFDRLQRLQPGKFKSFVLEDKKKLVGLMVADFAAHFSKRLIVSQSHPRHADEDRFFRGIISRVSHFDGFLANNFYRPDEPTRS